MHGRVFALKPKKMDGGLVRRVVAQRAVEQPAKSELNVTGYTVFRDLSNAWGTWASKPGSLRSEVRVARSLVPHRCKDVPVLVMNLASYPVTLTAGQSWRS